MTKEPMCVWRSGCSSPTTCAGAGHCLSMPNDLSETQSNSNSSAGGNATAVSGAVSASSHGKTTTSDGVSISPETGARTSKQVVHFYAGWCGKTLCAAAEVGPISSIKADDVTCETCKTMLMPARMIQPLVVDGDELAKIEDGLGDPAGTYLKYRGQVWINDGWLDESKVLALRDWLTACLPVETTASRPVLATELRCIHAVLFTEKCDACESQSVHGATREISFMPDGIITRVTVEPAGVRIAPEKPIIDGHPIGCMCHGCHYYRKHPQCKPVKAPVCTCDSPAAGPCPAHT